jgi:quinoprotein glucose dehydrogenase
MRANLLLLGALPLTVLLASAQEEETRSVQSGVYTGEQAERGAALFEDTCSSCHEPEEFGDGSYLDGWAGQTAHDLIEHIRATMPQDNPGSLKRQEYVDLLAYILFLNDMPSGTEELPVPAEALQKIVVKRRSKP